MEAATAPATKAANFPAFRFTVTSPRTIPRPKSAFLSLKSPTDRNKRSSLLSLARCFAKPITENGESDQNSTFVSKPECPSSLSSPAPTSSSPTGLVLGLALSADSWDSDEIGSPVVKRFLSDDEERWYMWYRGSSKLNPASDCVGLAVSSNGIHWERGEGRVESIGDVGLVMSCCKDWWVFDTENVRPGEVVIMSSTKVRANSSVYWMYYTGYSSEKVEFHLQGLPFGLKNPERFGLCNGEGGKVEVFRSLPGLAISQDGRNWARIEGEHHSGALFDVGSEQDWDFLFIASPHVVFHGDGDLRMYYHSFDAKIGEFCIGIARSRDGIKWVKLGKIIGGRGRKDEKDGSFWFDELGGINPCVSRNKRDGSYVMVYEGVDRDGKRSIGLAVSEDGLKDWKGVQDKAVLEAAEGSAWDNEGVGSPCLVQMEGDSDHRWRLYYRGIGNGGKTGIGMAISEGSDISRFRRQTGGIHL
ncbi:PREDICTED: uncharacterized protein LOC104808694 [Tarenaya hassleriana]|uniref:uncharacterized protein LOC104808694 n=1 Tax=Tarenaya hassleriana TaxID=28532 RepID=UPI00053C324E|nr:PREDICTED: uncharacterized protein LOC104808694 [Tarenaya hassleriana]